MHSEKLANENYTLIIVIIYNINLYVIRSHIENRRETAGSIFVLGKNTYLQRIKSRYWYYYVRQYVFYLGTGRGSAEGWSLQRNSSPSVQKNISRRETADLPLRDGGFTAERRRFSAERRRSHRETVNWLHYVYIAEVQRQLGDTNFYEQQSSDKTSENNNIVQSTIMEEINKNTLPPDAKLLINENPRTSTFYVLKENP